MEHRHFLIRPGYCIAILLIALPVLDTLASVWPLDLGNEQWRFTAVGALSTVGLTPLLGTFLALAIALVFDHQRTRQWLGWGAVTLAGLITLAMLVFLLDYLQTRAGVAAEWRSAMDWASILAILKQIALILGFTWIGLAGIRSSQSPKKRKRYPSQEPPNLIS